MESIANVFKSLPTTTVHQSRLQLYQPTRRPVWAERKIQTPWGSALVRGKLGQGHADAVEAICRNAEAYRVVEETGHLQILVDPYKVRCSVGGGSVYPQSSLWMRLTELREASITLEVPQHGLRVLGGIIDRVEESTATRHNPLTGQPRAMWRVTFDPAFAALLCQDLHLNYDPIPLSQLQFGVSQAVARHILTHRDQPNGGWLVDTLLHAVGAVQPTDPSATVRNRRRELDKDKDNLARLGIALAGKRLYRMDTLSNTEGTVLSKAEVLPQEAPQPRESPLREEPKPQAAPAQDEPVKAPCEQLTLL